jgi:hypothetical protein
VAIMLECGIPCFSSLVSPTKCRELATVTVCIHGTYRYTFIALTCNTLLKKRKSLFLAKNIHCKKYQQDNGTDNAFYYQINLVIFYLFTFIYSIYSVSLNFETAFTKILMFLVLNLRLLAIFYIKKNQNTG